MLAVALEVEPDLEDPRQALPFLNLSANGRPVRALLDSGAGRTSIAAPPGTTTRPADSTGTGAFGQPYRDQLWRATIAIDGTELSTLDIADAPTTGQFNIGQDLLSQFRCHFRLGDHQLLLGQTNPANHQPSDGEPIYLDPAKHVYFQAHWPSGVSADVVFDTGASVTIIDASFADRHPELLTAHHSSAGTDASGITQETPMLGWPLIAQVDWIIDHPAARARVLERS